MGLSGHEIWMILRARDEATRVMKSASASLLAMQNSGTSKQIAGIKKVMATDAQAYRSSKAVNALKIAQIKQAQAAMSAASDDVVAKTRNEIAEKKADLAAIKQRGNVAVTQSYAVVQSLEREIDALEKTELATVANAATVKRSARDKILAIQQHQNAETAAYLSSQENHRGVLAAAQEQLAKENEIHQKRQQASAQLQRVGSTLTTVGVAGMAAGGLIASAFVKAGQASMEYQKQVAYSFTQVDNGGKTTYEDIYKLGRDMAQKFPVPFEEIQPAIYDLFSSIDVDSTKTAQKFMTSISRASLAGQTSMENAGKSIIEILNAWELQAIDTKTGQDNLTMASDVMFQMVRKGIGNYTQFSNAIGRSIPSARKAGATIQDMGGAMAFLTRKGVSTQMASTALGRAFDLVSNPKFAKNMKEYGLTIQDAHGKFLPMVDIVDQLKTKTKGMTEVEVAAFLKKVTNGAGGTVQAMRFLNHAVMDSKGELRGFTEDMYNAKGATESAYKIMKKTPQMHLTSMINEWKILQETVGKIALEVLVPIMDGIKGVAKWFNSLDKGMQRNIVTFGLIASAVLIVGGAITAIIGGITMVAGALAAMGVSGGAVAAVAGVLAALAGAGALIAANWGTVKGAFDIFIGGVNTVLNAAGTLVDFFLAGFIPAFDPFIKILGDIGNQIMQTWSQIGEGVGSTIEFMGPIMNDAAKSMEGILPTFEQLKSAAMIFGQVFGGFLGIVLTAIMALVDILSNILVPIITVVVSAIVGGLMGLWAGIVTIFGGIVKVITGFVTLLGGIFTGNFDMVIQGIQGILGGLVQVIVGIFQGIFGAIVGVLGGLVNGIIAFFEYLYDVLVGHSIIPDLVNAIISWISSLPGKVIGFIATLVSQFIARVAALASYVGSGFSDIVSRAVSAVASLPGRIAGFVSSMASRFISIVVSLASTIASKFSDLVSKSVDAVKSLPGKISSALSGIASTTASIGKNIINGMVNGIRNAAGNLINAAKGAVSNAINAAKNLLGIQSPSKVFRYLGDMSVKGMEKGFIAGKPVMSRAGAALAKASIPGAPSLRSAISSGIYYGDDLANRMLEERQNRMGTNVNMTINTQEINPIKHAADLGYEISTTVGV